MHPVEVKRRKLRLTLLERIKETRENAKSLGPGDKDVLFMLVGNLTDEEASFALSALENTNEYAGNEHANALEAEGQIAGAA